MGRLRPVAPDDDSYRSRLRVARVAAWALFGSAALAELGAEGLDAEELGDVIDGGGTPLLGLATLFVLLASVVQHLAALWITRSTVAA